MNEAEVLLVRKLEKSPPVGAVARPSEGRACWAAAAARFASAAWGERVGGWVKEGRVRVCEDRVGRVCEGR